MNPDGGGGGGGGGCCGPKSLGCLIFILKCKPITLLVEQRRPLLSKTLALLTDQRFQEVFSTHCWWLSFIFLR